MSKYTKALLVTLFAVSSISVDAKVNFNSFPDLKLGQTSPFVKELQKVLNANGFAITTTGTGSLGLESAYFGSLTKKAVASFQSKNGISPVTGNLGTNTKAKLDEFLKTGKFKTISSGTPVAYGSQTCPSITDRSNSNNNLYTKNSEITWTFQGTPVCGQFANGDWWVVGPVTIANINPNSLQTTVPGVTQNGSMINPTPTLNQGFDSFAGYGMATTDPSKNMYGIDDLKYNPALNKALSFPFTVAVGSSLVSSVSDPTATYPTYIDTIAVLTVLDKVPPEGSFRPPVYGDDKTIRWNKSQINWGILKNLATVPGAPSKQEIEDTLPGLPWFEWRYNPLTGLMLPVNNFASKTIDGNTGQVILSSYGQDVANKWGKVALWLNLNNSQADKEYTMIQTIQTGIDLWGYFDQSVYNKKPGVKDGGLYPDGGQRAGRKFPAVLAAAALNDPILKNFVGSKPPFQEDYQTFFVCGAADSATCPPGHVNDVGRALANGHPSYTQAQVGIADWGIKHGTDPSQDNPIFSGAGETHYRHVNWPAMAGAVLAADLMNIESVWNHDAIFAYAERHIGTIGVNSIADSFVRNMWITHKNNGTVSTPTTDPVVTHPDPASFLCGDTIVTYKTTTYINSTESVNTPIANKPAGTQAVVKSGPVLANNIYWYSLDYGNGLVGYSGGDNFDLVSRGLCVGQTVATTSVTITPPTITSPASGTLLSNTPSVTLAWSSVSGANAYYVRMKEYSDSARTIQTGRMNTTLNTNPSSPFYLYIDGNTSRSIPAVDLDPNRYYELWLNAYDSSNPNNYSVSVPYYFNTTGSAAVPTYTLTASKVGTGTGFINGISAASTVLDSGTNITLTAQANPGSTFTGWGGDCLRTDPCVLTMNSDKTISATFTLNAPVLADEDNDGIVDSSDKCQGTPSGVKTDVNAYGCPKPVSSALKVNNDVASSDLTDIANLEIEDKNAVYGKIRYAQPVNIFGSSDRKSRINLDSYVTIGDKRVVVDSTNAPQLNKPATITLYNITLTKPLIKKNGEVYATSSSPLLSYDQVTKTLTFTVSGFSTYDVIEDVSVVPVPVVASVAPAPSAGGGSVSSSGGGGSAGGSNAPGAYVNPNNVGLGTVVNTNSIAATSSRYVFKKDLKVYARDPEVVMLQKFLNSKGYVVAKKGAGSPGLESNYFGPATKTALARFQKDNKIFPAAGYFGKLTKAALNK